jgi:hypothetical protein
LLTSAPPNRSSVHLQAQEQGMRTGAGRFLSRRFCRSYYSWAGEEGVVRETKRVDGDRLFVHLDYPDGGQDEFEWQLFSPSQIIAMAQSIGLTLLRSCTDFDAMIPPVADKPRVQYLFER